MSDNEDKIIVDRAMYGSTIDWLNDLSAKGGLSDASHAIDALKVIGALCAIRAQVEEAQELADGLEKFGDAQFARAETAEAKLSTIADIAEGSTTANSLQHIAKIAREALKL